MRLGRADYPGPPLPSLVLFPLGDWPSVRRIPLLWRWIAAGAALALFGLLWVAPVAVGLTNTSATTVNPGPLNFTSSMLADAETGMTSAQATAFSQSVLYQPGISSSAGSILSTVADAGEPSIAAAVTDGVITSGQASLVGSALASGAAVPATEAVGAGATAATVDAAGPLAAGAAAFVITGGVLRLAGVESDGSICMGTGADPVGSMVRFATGSNCGQFFARAGFVPNLDTMQWSGRACSTTSGRTTVCDTLQGLKLVIDSGGVWAYYNVSGTLYEGVTLCGRNPSTSYPINGQLHDCITSSASGTTQPLVKGTGCTNGALAAWNANPTGTQPGPCVYPWTTSQYGMGFSVVNALRYQLDSICAGTQDCWNSDGTAKAGTTVPTATAGADPSRQYFCRVLGTDGNSYDGAKVSNDEGSNLVPQTTCPTLPSGVGSVSVSQMETDPASLGGGTRSLTTTTVDPTLQRYPECQDGHCVLRLFHQGQDCYTHQASCTNWTQDPNKADDFSCRFGTHAVALSECNVLANRFDGGGSNFYATPTAVPATNPGTGTQIEPPTDPSVNPQPQPSGSSSPNPSSTTGTDPSASPSPTPGLGTTWDPLTAPDGNTDPGTGGDPYPGDLGNPQDVPNCMGAMWSSGFNPIAWVTVPVKCALQWAFVPNPTQTETDVQTMQGAWSGTPMGKLSAVLAGWNFVPPSSGCGGITVDLSWIHLGAGRSAPPAKFFNACPGDAAAPYAAWVKILLSAVVVIAGAVSIIRSVQGVVAYQGGV